MQTKFTPTRHFSLRRLLSSAKATLLQPRKKTVKMRPGDVPDYLRTDVGLEPPATGRRRGTDPPERDPFRLL